MNSPTKFPQINLEAQEGPTMRTAITWYNVGQECKRMARLIGQLLLFTWCTALYSLTALAQSTTQSGQPTAFSNINEIPPALQPWQAWVLAKHPQHSCPWLGGSTERQCLWVSRSVIDAHHSGADFQLSLQQFQDGWVTLPGDVRFWPQQVQARQGQQAPTEPAIRDLDGEPQIWLSRGLWQVDGQLRWEQSPEHIQIPEQSGIVALRWQQQAVQHPKRLGRQLWLQAPATATVDQAQDQLQIQVFRLLEDQIPARLSTMLQLDVSGSSREIILDQVLPPSFGALTIISDLPALLGADGKLRLQLQPGRWQVSIFSQSYTLPAVIDFPKAKAPWPDTEILAFAAAPELRTVRLSGATAIDPQQTQAPEPWRQYPLYQVSAGSSLQLEQQSRGAAFSQDQLQLDKTAWLDFNGNKLTIVDNISGQLTSSSRLQVAAPYQLGRAELAGEPQLITQLPQQQPGVELRQNPLQLTAVSTLLLDNIVLQTSLPVSGWQARFSDVSLQLQLPPGWSLLTATGADEIQGGYLQRWTLWDIFFVLLLSTACGRLFGWKLALLSLVCMLLLYQKPAAPQWLWLVLVALLALLKIASGRALLWLQRTGKLCSLALALLLLPFAVDQIRVAIYPQLEFPWHNMQYGGQQAATEKHAAAHARAERIKRSEQQKEQHMSDAEVALSAPVMSAAGAMEETVEELMVTGSRMQKKYADDNLPANVSLAQDPAARIQTGPARPDWQWQTVHLRWHGPVLAEEQTQLYLVPAWLNRIGTVLTVLLACWFWWLLSRSLWTIDWPALSKKPAVVSLLPALLILSGLFTPGPVFSQSLPGAELLAELEQRLLKRPQCLPQCSSISALQLTASPEQVQLALSLHSLEQTAWPLPVPLALVQQVTLDQQAAALFSEDDQHWLLLPKGRHQLQLTLNVANLQQLDIQFEQPWHQLTSTLNGWDLSVDSTVADDLTGLQQSRKQLKIVRTAQQTLQQQDVPTRDQKPDHQQSALQSATVLTRQIQLGLEWQLISTVERHGETGHSLQLSIPLLAGETPLSKLTVVEGKLQLQLAPDQHTISWVSRLAKTATLTLTAQQQPMFSEVWQLAASPQWHLQSTGIPAIADAASPLPQLWRPWPGEQLQLQISQPPAISGDTLTINRSLLRQQQGKRSSDVELLLEINASSAQNFSIELPADAEIMQLKTDDQVLPQPTGQLLQLPLRPGNQQLSISWKQPSASFWQHQTPTLDLGQAAGNIYLQLHLPADRWLWAVTGPAIGPAILFWGMLLVVLGLAVVLARVIQSPLTKRHWLLLFAGISTVSLWIPLLIALWLFSLCKRGQLQQPLLGIKGRLQQLSLVLLSLTAIGSLLLAIPYGLLSQPDMHLTGNGSYLQNLQWYQDATMGPLPVATAWSLPLWCYQLAMLLWSLWLATALVRWLPWAWRQLSYFGFWPQPAPVPESTPTEAAAQDTKTGHTDNTKTPDQP